MRGNMFIAWEVDGTLTGRQLTWHVAVFREDLTVMPVRNPNRSSIRRWKRIICHHSRPNRNLPKFTREISSES